MTGVFTFLGTGASAGVPVIGCNCEVCTSSFSKNRRYRPSGLIELNGKKFLIDIGPDFRSQALTFQVTAIDALLLTHTHYDHIAGVDEIRVFNIRQSKALPCLLSQESFEEMGRRYHYFFSDKLAAKIDCTILSGEMGSMIFEGIQVEYISFFQNEMKVTGYKFGDFAYISDIKVYDESIFEFLRGVKKLVISALRPEPSPFHLSFDEAIAFTSRVGASEAWITHLGHFLDHKSMQSLLPEHMHISYDGEKIEFECKM